MPRLRWGSGRSRAGPCGLRSAAVSESETCREPETLGRPARGTAHVDLASTSLRTPLYDRCTAGVVLRQCPSNGRRQTGGRNRITCSQGARATELARTMTDLERPPHKSPPRPPLAAPPAPPGRRRARARPRACRLQVAPVRADSLSDALAEQQRLAKLIASAEGATRQADDPAGRAEGPDRDRPSRTWPASARRSTRPRRRSTPCRSRWSE